jgi:hypothetical protein
MLSWLVGGDAEAVLENEKQEKSLLTRGLVYHGRLTDRPQDGGPLATVRATVPRLVRGAAVAPPSSPSTPTPDGTVSSMDLLATSASRHVGDAPDASGAKGAVTREYACDVVNMANTVLRSLGYTSSSGPIRPFTVAEIHEKVVGHHPRKRVREGVPVDDFGDGLVLMDVSIPDVRRALEMMANVHGPDMLGNYYWVPSHDSVREALRRAVREDEKNRFMRLMGEWRQLMADGLRARRVCVRVCEVGPIDFVLSHTVTIPPPSPSWSEEDGAVSAVQHDMSVVHCPGGTQRHYAIRQGGAVWLFHQSLSRERTLEFFLRVRHAGPDGRLLHEGKTVPFHNGKDEDATRESFQCDDVPQELFYGEIMVSLVPYYP